MDGNALATAGSAAVGLELVGVLLVTLGSRAKKGTLARTSSFGIRTKVTRASGAAWIAGHAAVAGACLGLGVFCVVAGLVLVVTGIVASPAVVVVAMLTSYSVLLLGMAGCTVVANRAARSAHTARTVKTGRTSNQPSGGRRPRR